MSNLGSNLGGRGAINNKNHFSTLCLNRGLLSLFVLLFSLFSSNVLLAATPEDIPNLTINLVDGTDGDSPLANTRISVREIRADGTKRWRKRITTNEAGQASVYLEGFATGSSYLLYARSTFNKRHKKLLIENAGTHTFKVGTPLLNITLRDAKIGNIIPDIRVTAYKIETGKRDRWLGRGTTDTNGQLSLDLPALSEGANVRLRADKAYNNHNAYSSIISTAGNFDFLLGSVQVKVLDAETNQPLANHSVKIYTRPAEGRDRWYGRAKTDSDGLLRLTLKGLDATSTTPTSSAPNYILKTRSPFNNRTKLSQIINHVGDYDFKVGDPLLNVTLKDASRNSAVIANTEIRAFSVFRDSNGKERRKWAGKATTNDQGIAKFDIPALAQEGTKIRLYTRVFNQRMWAKSQEITTSGEVDFSVGTTVVTVKDGSNSGNSLLPNLRVNIREVISAGGKSKSIGTQVTDSQGVLRLTLPLLGTGKSYLLRTKNPNSSVRGYKTSQVISQSGEHDFVVGTELLNVTLKDASRNGAVITNTEIRAFRITTDSQGKERRKWAGKATTNEQGIAKFDIPALSQEGTKVRLYAKVFNQRMWAKSQKITASGDADFSVGITVVTVKDGSNASNNILPNLKVNIREVLSGDKSKSIGTLITDSQGVLRLTLPLLGTGKSYLLRTKNPNRTARRYKTSQVINTLGKHDFIVGTELLNITLANAINNNPVANKRVDVYQDRGTERAKWLGKVTTDAEGRGAIDVPLLSEDNHTFFLRARHPYNAGNAHSAPFTSNTFNVAFPVGKTPVTLMNKDSGNAIVNKRIDAFEKLPTGKLKWRGKGNTDATGTVHFDLAQLALGKIHVFRTKNPFGEDKRYYSILVSAEGPVAFPISVDEDSPLDLKAPVVAITSPATGSDVGSTGFELVGTAKDNNEIEEITVTLDDGTTSIHTAKYDTSLGIWSLNIPATRLTTDTTLQVTVTVTDKAQNEDTITASYSIVADVAPPTIVITSPSDGDDVAATGFLVNGSVDDDTGVTTLHAQVQDSGNGSIIDRDLEVSSNGLWSLAINNGQLTEDGSVVVTLTATDVTNRQTVTTLNLNVVAVNNEARQMLNRITFGATSELLDEIRTNGVAAFLDAQLAPDSIDDSAFETLLANNGEPFSTAELQVYQLTHMIHSRRQLREVMAWFWENHFNTDVNKDGNSFSYELAEHDAFRANALGNFRTLLEISAKSPAMLIYLDGVLNVSSDANENYSREVMELSTCGVDACYTQDDVESLAEILTGWQVANDAFFFNADEHTAGSKVFQGVLIPEGGVEEGNTALDMLANHSATANYICSKLIQVFISDTPNADLNTRCASTFQSAANDDDQITQVLRTLLTSPEFNNTDNFNGKIKSPVEYAVGLSRALNAQGDFENLPGYIRRMGIRLFQNPVPTGWDEVGSAWVNSVLLLERTRFVNQIAVASSSSHTYIDPVSFFRERNLETAEGIVAYLLDLLGGDIWTDLERQTALNILNREGSFDINTNTANTLLRELIGTVQSYPEYNYQ